jgi:protein-disulfide isomerase
VNKRLFALLAGLALLSLLAGCSPKPAPTATPTPTPTPLPPTPTSASAAALAPAPADWNVYQVPDDQYAIALPPSWGNVDMDPGKFSESLDAAKNKYPDVGALVEGDAITLINAGVTFFGFDPSPETVPTGIPTDASVQRQSLGADMTLDEIQQVALAQLESAASVVKPVAYRRVALASGEGLEMRFTANATDQSGKTFNLAVTQYLVLQKRDIYVVTLSAAAELGGKYASVFEQIGGSLRFTPPKRYEVSLDDDPMKGSPDAPVTIVEFSEFQCPACGAYARDTFPQIDETYIKTGKVKYVSRDYPLSYHENAQKAAEAGECAAEQGKFWEYHDKLFASQDALDVPSLKKYAADLGLDTAKFDACLDSGVMAEEVQKDFAEGNSYGVRGTPAFFVNGIKLRGAQSFTAFQELIEEELKR